MERVQQYQVGELNESDIKIDKIDDTQKEAKRVVWFNKLRPLLDPIQAVNFTLITVLGMLLSLDEMMIRCVGRCRETHHIKNKPIGEGFKFFVLATIIGFVINFTPDRRIAEKKGDQEYEHNKKTWQDRVNDIMCG